MQQETPAQFYILQAIATGKNAASDIAKTTELSLPYVMNQLALLEARGQIIKLETNKQRNVGKPKKRYALATEKATITLLKKGYGGQYEINKPTKMLGIYLQLLARVATPNKGAFSEYFWYNVEYFEKLRGVAFIIEENNTVEILALTNTKNLDELRKHISNYTIKQQEYKGMRVACWVHTSEEIIHGVKNHDDYYINLMKRAAIMADPYGELQKTIEATTS
ncbi:MarR family transcriptional regulator [Candidatus Woesearchaeota archaeon]|nr:MarR family transcriptional regulator [Candidatus Woesearchaeota archaeon]